MYKNIWVKGMPFKMEFLIWRTWNGKIPMEEKFRRWGIEGPTDVRAALHLIRKHSLICF